jgi:hypothetical protein
VIRPLLRSSFYAAIIPGFFSLTEIRFFINMNLVYSGYIKIADRRTPLARQEAVTLFKSGGNEILEPESIPMERNNTKNK